MRGRPRVYNREKIGRLIATAVKNEERFAPISDRSLVDLVEYKGEKCSRSIVYHVRRALGIPSVRDRRKKYREGMTDGR